MVVNNDLPVIIKRRISQGLKKTGKTGVRCQRPVDQSRPVMKDGMVKVNRRVV